MNLSEVIDITHSFLKEQALPRQREAQNFYDRMTLICIFASLVGYGFVIYVSRSLINVSAVNLLIVLGVPVYLGASSYYLMTLLHYYIHASQYYSKKASFVMNYIVPILIPINSSGYRWGHFQHHLNTNRFPEEYDTLPPFKAEKTLLTFWFNVSIHSFLLLFIFIVRIIANPFLMFSEKQQLIYFNYISPIGRISPKIYPPRKSDKEFKNNLIGNVISLVSLLIFWAFSGFSLMFWVIYLLSLYIFSFWLAFRSLVDHACVDVQGKEEVMKANFYFTSNFERSQFWYTGFATYHLVHHINPSMPHYFCHEMNDLLCQTFPDYQKLHQKRNNLPLVIRDFFAKDVTAADLLEC